MMDYYISIEDVHEEIQRRNRDEQLRKRLIEYLDGDVPEPLQGAPRAVLARNIATPDGEFMHFLDLAKQLGLEPLSMEYVRDKFFTMNIDKMGYADLRFLSEKK